MPNHAPATALLTHEVTNQPGDFAGRNLWRADLALRDAVLREGGEWLEASLDAAGAAAGSERVLELGELANRHPPELLSFDRYGRRLDEVRTVACQLPLFFGCQLSSSAPSWFFLFSPPLRPFRLPAAPCS